MEKPGAGSPFLDDALLERIPDGEEKTRKENGYKAQQDPISFGRAHLN